MNSFYNEEELKNLGLKTYGKDVLISRNATIYGAHNISIGNNVRIDDFCILSGKINLGNHIHIAAGTMLYGGEYGITMEDFSCLSSRCAVYALSDDYSGETMANSVIPEKYKHIIGAEVYIGKHALIGTGCTILPGIRIGTGASIGAMSLVNKDIAEFTINIGIPCRKLKERSTKMLDLEQEYLLERSKVEKR